MIDTFEGMRPTTAGADIIPASVEAYASAWSIPTGRIIRAWMYESGMDETDATVANEVDRS